MAIPQVSGGRYPTAPPRHVQASVPDYSAGIDKIAQGVGTVNEADQAYQKLVQKKAEAIQARQIAEAKQAEQERSAGVRERETERAHKANELKYKRDFDEKKLNEIEKQRKMTDMGTEINDAMTKNPNMSATQMQNVIIAAQARQGLAPGRPMNPPSSTTFNIKSGQERERANLQIPPQEAELEQSKRRLDELMGQEFTKTVLKSGIDPETFMKTNKQYTLPDEKGKAMAVKAEMQRIRELMDRLQKTYSMAQKEFPIEQHYPTAPIDSLNPAGLNLPPR